MPKNYKITIDSICNSHKKHKNVLATIVFFHYLLKKGATMVNPQRFKMFALTDTFLSPDLL